MKNALKITVLLLFIATALSASSAEPVCEADASAAEGAAAKKADRMLDRAEGKLRYGAQCNVNSFLPRETENPVGYLRLARLEAARNEHFQAVMDSLVPPAGIELTDDEKQLLARLIIDWQIISHHISRRSIDILRGTKDPMTYRIGIRDNDVLLVALANHYHIEEASAQGSVARKSSALHYAIRDPHEGKLSVAIIELLLAAGANINAKDETGSTPLHLLIERGPVGGWPCTPDYYAVLHLLIATGADVNAQDLLGRTPLHSAVENTCGRKMNDPETVKILLAVKGIQADKPDNYRITPAQTATQGGNDHLRYLIEEHLSR